MQQPPRRIPLSGTKDWEIGNLGCSQGLARTRDPTERLPRVQADRIGRHKRLDCREMGVFGWLIVVIVVLIVAAVAFVIARRKRRGGGVIATRGKR